MTQLRVGLISPVFPYPRSGIYVGIERHALELSRHLRKIGCSITVFTTFWNGGSDGDQFEGMTLRRATDLSRAIGRSAALFDLHNLTWGRSLLRHEDVLEHCDVLHSLGPLSSSRVLVSKGLPLVTHFHHNEVIVRPRELLHKPFHHRLERRAYHNSTLVAALSQHSARSLEQTFHLPKEKIRIIPDGVDLDRFGRRSQTAVDTPVILCVGTHEKRKGLIYLWQALDLLQKRGLDFRVVTVGFGPETHRLKALASKLELDSRIHFAGYVDPLSGELPQIYRQADILVHPSLDEGFGMVLIEAMASEIPVVATTSGAMPEVVGDAGVLVPSRNPEALAEAIGAILLDSELSESMGRRGRARAEALFGWDRIAERTLQVYEEAIRIAGTVP